MARCLADLDKSVLVVVDVQPKFMIWMFEAERVRERSLFIASCAAALGCPVVATEQNPERMGGTASELIPALSEPPESKMEFSGAGCKVVSTAIHGKPKTVILVGIETHICVNQTAHHLMEGGHKVIVCADAVSARTSDRHELGLSRLRDAGAIVAHTEAIVYEWMKSANHAKFRDVLKLVKGPQPVS